MSIGDIGDPLKICVAGDPEPCLNQFWQGCGGLEMPGVDDEMTINHRSHR